MKRLVCISVAAALYASAAAAGDKGTVAPKPQIYAPAVSQERDWSGLYGSIGVSYTRSTFSTDSAYEPATATGPGVSAIIGYNWQQGGFVYGAELVSNIDDIKGRDTGCGVGIARCESRVQSYLTLRGRAGMTMGDTLLFGTLGVTTDRMASLAPWGVDRRHYGVTVGVGVEQAISARWSVRGDLEYHRFQSREYTLPAPVGTTSIRPSHTAARLGMTYRF